jgi:ABC-type nitrate/sulfonate/bicarbonate transport system permease component
MADSLARTAPSRGELAMLWVVGAVVFFGLWQLVAGSGLVTRLVLPSPVDVVTACLRMIVQPFAGDTLQGHVLASLGRWGLGFSLAAVIGVPLGLAMGHWRLLDDMVSPVFEAYRYVAPLAWVPFAALWFGTGIGGPTLIIFAGAFPPCLINAYRGARFVSRPLIEAAQMLGTGNLRIILEVLLPASTASIVAGLRVSAGLGWQSLIGAELIAASTGVGFMMAQAQLDIATSTVMSAMIAIGLVGVVIDVALRALEAAVRRRGLA